MYPVGKVSPVMMVLRHACKYRKTMSTVKTAPLPGLFANRRQRDHRR